MFRAFRVFRGSSPPSSLPLDCRPLQSVPALPSPLFSLLPTLDCRPLQSVPALPSPLSSLLPTSRDSEAPYFGFFVYFVVTRRLPVCKRKKTENPKISWLEVNIWGGL